MRPPERARPIASSRRPDAFLAEGERRALEALRVSIAASCRDVVDPGTLRAGIRARPVLAVTVALAAGALLAPVLGAAARRLGPRTVTLLLGALGTGARSAEPRGPRG